MLLAVVTSDGEGFKTYVVRINFALWKLELCCDGENAAASANIGWMSCSKRVVICSVSGRGTSTAGETTKSRP